MSRDFLRTEHPIYKRRKEEWETNERRFRGGRTVTEELVPFDWETRGPLLSTSQDRKDEMAGAQRPGEHYKLRRAQAIYPNFPGAFAGLLVGHLMRQSPEADQALQFGGLGKVQRPEGAVARTRAELLWYNVDGVGNDGSQWNAWWDGVVRRATVTGHRWLFVESSRLPGFSIADSAAGRRPWLVELSPLALVNWFYDEGALQWAVQRISYRAPRLGSSGALEDNDTKEGFRLMVRKGFAGLGADYTGGGWWDFNTDLDPLPAGDGKPRRGVWDMTLGEIPLWPHFYERDPEEFSRAGVTELGNAAVAYMNLDSAANFDVWDAAMSLNFLMGVTSDQYKLMREKLQEGSRFIPIPPGMEGVVPSIVDASAGAVGAGIMNDRLDRIKALAREVAGMEITSSPDSSGLSKEMGFAEARSPRLALLASEVETSQNIALHYLERRWGVEKPSAVVRWPREFDLIPLLQRIEAYFGLEVLTGYRSPTVSARAMLAAAQEAHLVTDEAEAAKIQAEYEASIAGRIQENAGLGDQLRSFGATGEPLEPAA